jgi:WD40 repeat protein
LEQILLGAGEARAHLEACAVCRRLAELAGASPAAAATSDAPEDLPVVDRDAYEDVEELKDGRGGMGRTFRARDRRLGRIVALKEPLDLDAAPDGSAAQREQHRRFAREAKLTARLEHPAIVAVHEAGRWPGGRPFYAMRFVAGTPLDEEIARRPALVDRIGLLPSLVTVAQAVAYAHEQRIVHRDVKPQNVILGPFGETVLIDWGLAKDLAEGDDAPAGGGVYRAGGAGDLTQLGAGTASYMPPEQAQGGPPAPGMDVYALGATLYHTLAGRPPYGLVDAAAARRLLLAGPPPPLESAAPDVPPELAAITAKAMARRPEDRFATAKDLAAELERYLAGRRLRTYRYSTAELLGLFARRNRTAIRVAIAALVALAAVSGLGVARVVRERNRAEQGERAARRELSIARGVTASRLAGDMSTRLDALALGVAAVAGAAHAGTTPSFEARQGLFDAVTSGPPALLLTEEHGAVYGADTSADERLIATASDDGMVRVLDAASGRLVASRRSPLPRSSFVAFDPSASLVIAWGYDEVAMIWRVGSEEDAVLRPGGTVPAAGWIGPDLALTAGTTLSGWDAHGHERMRIALPAQATSMAVSPRRDRAAVGMIGGGVVLWDAGAGSLRALTPHAADAKAMAFTPDGAALVTAGRDGRILLHDLGNGGARVVATFSDLLLSNGMAMAPDGRRVAVCANSGSLMGGLADRKPTVVVDLSGATAPAHLDGMGCFGRPFTPDGARLFEVGEVGVSLHDAASHAELMRFETGLEHPMPAVFLLARDPAAARLLIAGSMKEAPRIVDARTGIASGILLGHTGEISGAWIAPGGARLLTASLDGTARIWDPATGRETAALRVDAEIVTAAWIDDARAVAATADGGVHVLDTRTGQRIARFEAGAPIRSLAVAPSGRRVAVCAVAGGVALVDTTTGSLTRRLDAGGLSCEAVAFSPDGARVAAGHAGGRVLAWDAGSGALVAHAEEGAARAYLGVTAVHFTRDGKSLLVGFGDGASAVLDAATLATRRALEGRVLSAPSTPFSPDGARAVAVTPDGRVLIHDLAGGGARTLEGHRELVLAASFSPDGSRLATADIGGTVRLWDLDHPGDPPITLRARSLGEATAVAFASGGDHLFVGYGSGALRMVPATVESAAARACATLALFSIPDRSGYCGSRRTSANDAHDR